MRIRFLLLATCVSTIGTASAASLSESLYLSDDLFTSFNSLQRSKNGYDALAVPLDYSTVYWAGDPVNTVLDAQLEQRNASGTTSTVHAIARSTVGYNRVFAEAVAGDPRAESQISPTLSYMTALAASSWDVSFMIVGGSGVGTLSFREYVNFDYTVDVGAADSSASLDFNAGVYTGIDSRQEYHNFHSVNYTDLAGARCETMADGDVSSSCSGGFLLGSVTHNVQFTYGQPIYVTASVGVRAFGSASVTSLHTGGISDVLIPAGASFVYAYGRSDNPLGISAMVPVPEPGSAVLLLAGLLAMVGAGARSRRASAR